VQIYSEVGEGTTIKIYLPRYHSSVDKDEEQGSDVAVGGAKHETILVVEDDKDVRSYTTETLRELGYTVLEAANGETALQLLDHHPEVSVLFTDVGLPGGVNGRRLAEEARKRCDGIKVLFTTGYARNAIVHDGRLDPGVELLPKPFTQAALAEKLRDIIDAKTTAARVLVVEDETLIQMLAMEYLQEAGLKVDLAASATDALNKLRLIPGGVDAVVLDVGLPDRNGDALVDEIRAIYPSLPLVIASGREQDNVRSLFKDVPLISFVNKPYTADALIAALRGVGIGRSAR
jgi:CheY-like chemotaxis protein